MVSGKDAIEYASNRKSRKVRKAIRTGAVYLGIGLATIPLYLHLDRTNAYAKDTIPVEQKDISASPQNNNIPNNQINWITNYFKDMKYRSPVLDMNGRADPSTKKFGKAISENYHPLGNDIKDIKKNVGYSWKKTLGRIEDVRNRFKDIGGNFRNAGIEKAPRMNKYLFASGAPGRIGINLVKIVEDILDIPTAGVVTSAVSTVKDALVGTVKTGLDSVSTVVGGTISCSTQPLEEGVYGNSYLSKSLDYGVGTSTRYLENILNTEAIDNANLSNEGNDKSISGSSLELLGSYALFFAGGSSSGGSSGGVPGVNVGSSGSWGSVGE